MTAKRADLVIEVQDTTDGSGNWTGEWIDSGGFKNVLIGYEVGTAGVRLEFSSDGSAVLTNSGSPVASGTVIGIGTRFFRAAISGGTPNDSFWLVGRIWD